MLGTGAVRATPQGYTPLLASQTVTIVLERRRPSLRDASEGGQFVEDPTDADYARAATWALSEKQHPYALLLISAALAIAPNDTEHLRLLDRILDRTRAPLAVLALRPGTFYGLCAVRGWALFRHGRVDEAVEHVLRAAAFEPSLRVISWIERWVDAPSTRRRVSSETLAQGTIEVVDGAEGRPPSRAVLDNLQSLLHVIERAASRAETDNLLAVAGSRVLRSLARADEARAWLLAHGDARAWEVAVEAAAIAGDEEDREAREAWLKRAAEARPNEPSTWLDLGDAAMDEGNLASAREAFERAAALVEGGPLTETCHCLLAYATALQAESATPSRSVRADALEETGSPLARRLLIDLAAYIDVLPDPVDALVGVIRNATSRASKDAGGFTVRARAERALCPSAAIAWRLGERRRGGSDTTLEVSIFEPGSRAAAPPYGPLFDPAHAWPASSRDGERARVELRAIAQTAYSLDRWWDLAARAAGVDPRAFVGAARYIPEPPPDHDECAWVVKWQVAAGLLAARAGAPHRDNEPLLRLLDGVGDWSSIGAVIALFRAAIDAGPEARLELAARLGTMIPPSSEPLLPASRAVAVLGSRLSEGRLRARFLALRARVAREVGRFAGVSSR